MKIFYIEELKTSIVCLNKSGSLLILNTFTDFCYYKGYTIVKDKEELTEDTKTFIFVRNPIDRFKTSFTWFLRHEEHCINLFNVHDPIKMFTIENFIKFINKQDEIYKINDTHFLPQKYDLLGKKSNEKFNINDKLVENLYPNYTFIKLEDFSEKLISAVKLNTDDILHNVNTYAKEKGNLKADDIFLDSLDSDDFKLFSSLYLHNKLRLDSHHHGNKSIEITQKIESDLFLLLEDEFMLYGYKKKPYYRRMF